MDLRELVLETIEEVEEEEIKEENCNNKEFLEKLREKLLVLFDGLQSPNTENLDVKLDVTLNFLEYLLARIDEELQK